MYELISVIVPIYNAGKYLDRCIMSITNQTMTNLDIILIDDGSTDNSAEIMNRFERADRRITAIYKQNGGPNSARKLGVECARGKYIIFVDADDYIENDLCMTLLKKIKQYNVQIVGSGIKYINSSKEDMVYDLTIVSGKHSAENLINTESFYSINRVTCLFSYIFETEIIKYIFKNFDLSIDFSEDVICLLLALWDADKVAYIDYAGYIYCENEESFTKNHQKRHYECQRKLYLYGEKQLRDRKASEIMYKQLGYLVIRDLLIAGYQEAFGELNYLYPFTQVGVNSRVVVYGAGAMGIELVRYINNTSKYELVGWIDKKYESITSSLERVDNPSSLTYLDFDYVVIAVTNICVATKIREDLVNMKIPKEKIKNIDDKLINLDILNF